MKTKHMTGRWASRVAGNHRVPGLWKISSSESDKIGALIAAWLDRWIPGGHEDGEGFYFGPPPAVKIYAAAPVDWNTAVRGR